MSRQTQNIVWTGGMDQTIRDNVGKVSYSEIAKLLPGLSRSAVIGRASRLGLAGTNEKPVISKGTRANAPRKRIVVVRAPSQRGERETFKQVLLREPAFMPLADLVCEPVSMLDRQDGQCSWPIDGGMYCGLKVLAAHADERTGRRIKPVYCPSHHHHSITPGKYRSGIWRSPA